jgi:hypothetical protein
VVEGAPNENAVGVVLDPKAAGLLAVLPKLKEDGEVVVEENVPKPLVVFDVPVLPKEKVDGVVFEFDVLFPKLNELFVDPVLLLLVLPKLNCEGEFVGALKLPKVEVEVFVLLFPNPVEGVAKFPKDVVVPKVEFVEAAV